MANKKTKFKGVVKGAALGFALMMASAFFPANAIASAVEPMTGDTARINTSRIQVDGENRSFNVKKGETVSIPEAEYLYKKQDSSQGTHIIGGTVADSISESTVDVFYKATGDKVNVNEGTFVADKVGTYVIVYTVVDNGVSYSHEQVVVSEATEASFEFKQNDKNVLPSVYDIELAAERNLVLPLPTVNDEDGQVILTSADDAYYVLDKDTSSLPKDDPSTPEVEEVKNVYVSISLANGKEKVSIQEGTNSEGKKEFFISGTEIAESGITDEDIKIVYSFYQKTNEGSVFVSSTSKTVSVKANHYYKDSKKQTAGCDIIATLSGKVPDSAIVGVEKELPKITATTSASNSPANEAVEVYYQLFVYKMNADKNYNDNNDVTAQVITKDGKFKAVEEGSYKFVYRVSDFYGNKGTESRTTFTISDVKDTVSATAYIYDASNKNAYDKINNKYESAESLLKNQTVDRNIVMYAVGGTDNMVKRYEDLTEEEKENDTNYISLKRVIKDNSGIERFVVDNEAYNSYNLIFAPAKSSNASTVWQSIVKDNYQLYKQMISEQTPVDVTDDSAIKEYLLENNYLLVTTEFNKDVDGNTIDDTITGEDDATATEKMLAKGYAYIAPETSGYTFKNQSYTFYYYAKDNVNNNKESFIYYTIKLSEGFSDNSIPTVNFSTDLQSAYLPSETFEFNVASATDSIDSRLNTVTAYRYLGADKLPLEASETAGTTSTLEYYLVNANTDLLKDPAKWYAKEGKISRDGWFIDQKASSYKVDLSKKPVGANYVEILAYAIDDYGNVGFFNKVIRIADATDSDMPNLYKVVNAPETTAYTAPSEIALPTLYFADKNSNYMHAQVNVYKLVKEGNVVVDKVLVQRSGMKTDYDTNREYFKVDAGVFKASTAGDYQATITVVDSGNHSVTSFFNYTVKLGETSETPKIDNISSNTIELVPGKSHYLVPPTFTMIKSDKYGYIGINEQDDSYTATYYNVSIISATSSDYELDESYFTGNSEGTYQLQYTAFLLQYEKSALVEAASKSAGKLYFKDSKLKFYDGTNDYFVYIDQDNGNKLAANTSLQGDGLALDDMSTLNTLVSVYVDKSDVQIIKVSEVFIKVLFEDDAYVTDKFEELGQSVKVEKPSVDLSGKAAQINQKESTVTITRTSGNTTVTLATLNFKDWQKALATDTSGNFKVVGSDIFLVMKDHGEYKIKYSIQAQDAYGVNVGDPNTEYSYTLSSGDTTKPTIEADNKVVTKDKYGKSKQVFNIGDKLVIDMAGLTVSDNKTTDRDDLLSRLEVTVRNTTLNESAKTLENKATEEGKYIYEIEQLKTAGDYVLTFTVRDEVGNISKETTVKFEVSTTEKESADAKEVMGGVLIGVSVALLVGVVGYFVVSKVKLDKKEKSYKKERKDRK